MVLLWRFLKFLLTKFVTTDLGYAPLKLSLFANFYILVVCDLNSMTIINSRIYKRFEDEYLSRCSFSPISNLLYIHRIKITNTEITKMCNYAKIWVQNLNQESELSYDVSGRYCEKF